MSINFLIVISSNKGQVMFDYCLLQNIRSLPLINLQC